MDFLNIVIEFYLMQPFCKSIKDVKSAHINLFIRESLYFCINLIILNSATF